MKSRKDRIFELVKKSMAQSIYLEALENAVADEEQYFFDSYYVPEDNVEYHKLLRTLFERSVRYDKEIAELEALLMGENDDV